MPVPVDEPPARRKETVVGKTELDKIYEAQKRKEDARKEAERIRIMREHYEAKLRRDAERDARRGPR